MVVGTTDHAEGSLRGRTAEQLLYGLWLRSSRPDVYQGIGLGP
jgi:hypothetical protein